jgi:membrane-bound lytic murein transglycosylase B
MSDQSHRGSAVRRLAIAGVAISALALSSSAAATSGSPEAAPAVAEPAVLAPSTETPTDPAGAGDASATESVQGTAALAKSTTANPKAAGLPSVQTRLTGDNAIPATVLAAYRKAAATLAVDDSSCHLTWPLLAGIGKVETDHGRTWGSKARLTASGEAVPTILGPVLNGHDGTAKLLDTDGGAYDRDRKYDRAVGPMQFVPSTWREVARDGNDDGVKDPNNVWDATLGAADYLCANNRDLANPAERRSAILAYNPSSAYVRSVLAWAAVYQKAGTKLSSLQDVPSPLVLGAGGDEGDGAFGDTETDLAGAGFYGDSGFGTPDTLPVTTGSSGDALTDIFADSPTVPSLSPSPKPTKKPTKPTKPAVRPASSKPKPKPTTPGPTRTPSPTASPKPGSTKPASPKPAVASPSHGPTPTPSPAPASPACVDTGIAAASTELVTVTPVDSDDNGSNDVLHITTDVVAAKAGRYSIAVRLQDADGYGISGTSRTITLAAGPQTISADLPGRDIGDAGVAGAATLRIAVRAAKAPSSCAEALFTNAKAGELDPSTFDGWVTTLDRLRARLTDDIASGRITGQAATDLPAALKTPTEDAPDLGTFRSKLQAADEVTDGERARLDNLAERLLSQTSPLPSLSPEPTPAQDPSDQPQPTEQAQPTDQPEPTDTAEPTDQATDDVAPTADGGS